MSRLTWTTATAALCIGVIAVMVTLTVMAVLGRDIVRAATELFPNPWFRACLADLTFSLLALWAWVASREPTWPRRILWLVLFCSLGSMVAAAYVLLQLRREPRPSRLADLLAPRRETP